MHSNAAPLFFLLSQVFYVNFIASFQTQFIYTEITKRDILLYYRISQINEM